MTRISYFIPGFLWLDKVTKTGGDTDDWVVYGSRTVTPWARYIIFGLILVVDTVADFRLTVGGATNLWFTMAPAGQPVSIHLPVNQPIYAKPNEVVTLELWVPAHTTISMYYNVLGREEYV